VLAYNDINVKHVGISLSVEDGDKMTDIRLRGVIDKYAEDDCLYPDKVCEQRHDSYCIDSDGAYKCLLEKISELGLVRKVEGELPKYWYDPNGGQHYNPDVLQDYLKDEGYTLTEELDATETPPNAPE